LGGFSERAAGAQAHVPPRADPASSSINGAVTERDWALLLHLAGVLLLFSGMAVAAVAHAGARRRTTPGEVAALLGMTRSGVALVVFGGLLIVASGLWLIEVSDGVYSLGDGWIAGSLGLLVLAFVLGAAGGQRPKRARRLATRAAAEGEVRAGELRALLDDRLSRAFNYAAAFTVVAALVIMVWKPGL
jgi:uncharacterized membrane protein